jgi:hypothetical protein
MPQRCLENMQAQLDRVLASVEGRPPGAASSAPVATPATQAAGTPCLADTGTPDPLRRHGISSSQQTRAVVHRSASVGRLRPATPAAYPSLNGGNGVGGGTYSGGTGAKGTEGFFRSVNGVQGHGGNGVHAKSTSGADRTDGAGNCSKVVSNPKDGGLQGSWKEGAAAAAAAVGELSQWLVGGAPAVGVARRSAQTYEVAAGRHSRMVL